MTKINLKKKGFIQLDSSTSQFIAEGSQTET